MRFDDSLRTVLAAESASPFGAAAAWRQLVDLIGRGRTPATAELLGRLRDIRGVVPARIRAATARSLAAVAPGAALTRLFAEDDPHVAAPVLRAAVLAPADWIALLPMLTPTLRAVLRHRRDLPADVGRALGSYGSVDFLLPDAGAAATSRPVGAGAPLAPASLPTGSGSFVPLSAVALGLPVVAEAMRRAREQPADGAAGGNGFPISDLVARIEAFRRDRETSGTIAPPAAAPDAGPAVDRFSFETDMAGTIRWVEGVPRPPVVGLSIAGLSTGFHAPGVDGAVAGAFRRRSSFRDARLSVGGTSAARGAWRIAGEPRFDSAGGRFVGYRGEARRPRADESAAPRSAGADALRQLVHELRTPATAIAGFAELIEREMLGEVSAGYRARAATIRDLAGDLVAAIDDLDTAARIEGNALELRPGQVALAPLLRRAIDDLADLARTRGASLSLVPVPAGLVLDADDRAAERLVSRLLAALLSAAGDGERLVVTAMRDTSEQALLVIDRPTALASFATAQLLSLDVDDEATGPSAPLLGVGFSLRLVQSLARELGGALGIEPRRLTLRLPAIACAGMEVASTR